MLAVVGVVGGDVKGVVRQQPQNSGARVRCRLLLPSSARCRGNLFFLSASKFRSARMSLRRCALCCCVLLLSVCELPLKTVSVKNSSLLQSSKREIAKSSPPQSASYFEFLSSCNVASAQRFPHCLRQEIMCQHLCRVRETPCVHAVVQVHHPFSKIPSLLDCTSCSLHGVRHPGSPTSSRPPPRAYNWLYYY